MVPALLLVLAAWCPSTTTAPDRPQCPCDTTTTTAPPEATTTSGPAMVIEPPHPTTTTTMAATTTTTVPTIVDAIVETRPPARHDDDDQRLPVTGPDGHTLVAAGALLLLGGLFIAARPRAGP